MPGSHLISPPERGDGFGGEGGVALLWRMGWRGWWLEPNGFSADLGWLSFAQELYEGSPTAAMEINRR